MQSAHSRVTLEINISAIRRNYRRIREFVAPLEVMAVLKANAYGLGSKGNRGSAQRRRGFMPLG